MSSNPSSRSAKRWTAAALFLLLLVPATATAHELLSVEEADGVVIVTCGGQTTESSCSLDDPAACDSEMVERTCRKDQEGAAWCLGPEDVVCCSADPCPLVERYEVTCVPVPSSGAYSAQGAFLCIYDVAGSSTCAEQASTDPELALRCHSTGDGGIFAPVAAENGDCDRDGIPNVRDDEPCGPVDGGALDAGAVGEDAGAGGHDAGAMRADAGELRYHYRGGGGCACAVAPPGPSARPFFSGLTLPLLIALWRRRTQSGRSRIRRRDTAPSWLTSK